MADTNTKQPAASTGLTAATAFASASLYVGDLHKDVTEAMLYEVFNAVGPVSSIRVCRDSMSRKSLGYAYVNYHSHVDAEKALDTLNFQPIKGQPARIMWSHRDPAMRRGGAGNIFVKNLDKSIDNAALADTFSVFGSILSCKVAMDDKGQSRGFGFVHYLKEEDAKTAIERVNGMQIGGKTVYVGPFVRKADRHSGKEENYTNVYAKNFPSEWTEETVRNLFAKFGKITSLATFKDRLDRPFAFVNFEKPEEAKTAVMELNDRVAGAEGLQTEAEAEAAERHPVDQEMEEQNDEVDVDLHGKEAPTEEAEKEEKGEASPKKESESKKEEGEKEEAKDGAEEKSEEKKDEASPKKETSAARQVSEQKKVFRLYVARAQTKAERAAELKRKYEEGKPKGDKAAAAPAGLNLYIKNLHESVDDEKLRELFAAFGDIASCKVMRDTKGISRGFAFVCYKSPDEATKAVTEMHLKLVHNKPLYVGLAEKKEERERRLLIRYQNPATLRSEVPRPASGVQTNPMFGGMNPMMFGGMQGPRGPIAGNPMAAMMANMAGMNPMMGAGMGRGAMPGGVRPMGMAGMQGMGGMGGMQGMQAAMAMRQNMQGVPQQMGGMAGFNPAMAAAMGQMGAFPGAGVRPGVGRGPAGRGIIPAAAVGLQGFQAGPKAGMMPKQPAMMGQAAPGNFQFTEQARNAAMPRSQAPVQAPQVAAAIQQQLPNVPPEVVNIVASDAPLTAAALAAAPPSLQKQMLGEKLFPLISRMEPNLAGKITGMMLEMDNAELLVLLESEQQLRSKVDEALEVLRQTDGAE